MVQKVIATELATKVAKNKATPYIIGGVILVSLGLTYFGIVRPLLCFFKVLDCGRSKEETEMYSLDAFNPQLANPNNTSITPDFARTLANQIEESLGYGWNPASWVNDDEEGVYGAIAQAGSVANMSLVSRYYASMFNESLIGRITSKMNSEELTKIKTIIRNYKK
jgi:hypothetical protein